MNIKISVKTSITAAVGLSAALNMVASAAFADSRQVRYLPAYNSQPAANVMMEPKNVPDFQVPAGAPQRPGATAGATRALKDEVGTPLQADLQATTLPVETRLRLILECAVDAKSSRPGDIFEGHVKDDLFLGTQLLLPKGSLVRGRVSEVTKPRLLSRAAKIGLKLEQIVTPTGEVVPLDAALEFKKGTTNARGQLDPGTSFGSRVSNDVKSVTGMNSTGTARGALMAANIATLGAPAAATFIGGSAIALFSSGDNVMLTPGQELEILLTNDLGVQVN